AEARLRDLACPRPRRRIAGVLEAARRRPRDRRAPGGRVDRHGDQAVAGADAVRDRGTARAEAGAAPASAARAAAPAAAAATTAVVAAAATAAAAARLTTGIGPGAACVAKAERPVAAGTCAHP